MKAFHSWNTYISSQPTDNSPMSSLYLCFQIFEIGSKLWLSAWASSREKDTDYNILSNELSTVDYISVYGTLGLFQSMTFVAGIMTMNRRTLSASFHIHQSIFQRVMHSTIDFIWTTPVGQVSGQIWLVQFTETLLENIDSWYEIRLWDRREFLLILFVRYLADCCQDDISCKNLITSCATFLISLTIMKWFCIMKLSYVSLTCNYSYSAIPFKIKHPVHNRRM